MKCEGNVNSNRSCKCKFVATYSRLVGSEMVSDLHCWSGFVLARGVYKLLKNK